MAKSLFTKTATNSSISDVNLEQPQTHALTIAKTDQTVVSSDSENLPNVKFTAKEQEEIIQIAGKLDPRNLDTVLSFGQEPSSRIADFSDKILTMTKSSDTGSFGTQLTSVVNLARGVNFQGISDHKSQVPIIGGLLDLVRKKTGDVKTSFDSISTQIETAVKAMDITERNLTDRLAMFETMHAMNIDEYRNFCKYKVAGQSQLTSLSRELETQKLSVTATTDPMDVQKINDFAEYVKQLEKRLHDFDIAKMLCVQTAIELRMLQTNNRDLISQFKDIKTMTIPAWKKQFTLYVSLQEQKNAAEVTKKSKDFTNELLKANAEILGQNSIAIAAGNQRALVDVETIAAVNQSLINACTKVQQIESDGQLRRQNDSVRIEQLAGELRTKLTSSKAISTH